MKKILLGLLLALFAFPAFAQATYPTVAGSRVNGVVPLLCNANGANCAPSAGATNVVTSALASGLIAKASAGAVYEWQVSTGATAGHIMTFDAATIPADGAVTPLHCVHVAANATVAYSAEIAPLQFSTGFVVTFSTTGCFTKTASATAHIRARVQ